LQATLGVLGVLLVGAACGAINGLIVIFGRLQPIVTTIATGAIYYGARSRYGRSRAATSTRRSRTR
jgi:ribose/xylose/arabinose/galactoside ABC-type transport system permease subunit